MVLMDVAQVRAMQAELHGEQEKVRRLAEALARVGSHIESLGYDADFVDPDGLVQDIVTYTLLDGDLTHAQELARMEDHARWMLKMSRQESEKIRGPLVAWYRSLGEGPFDDAAPTVRLMAVAREFAELEDRLRAVGVLKSNECPF